MPSLRFTADWIDSEENFYPEFDASLSQLGIEVDSTWLTEWETESGAHDRRLEVPAFPLAEWIAENWWSLLYEPEKGGQSRHDPAFRARHWIGTAREGFVLPNAWLFSAGRGVVQIKAEASPFPHARMILRNAADAQMRTDDVARELGAFVDSVVDRLTSKGVSNTNLHQIWMAYKGLDLDEQRFCRLLGALGISPYDAAPDIADLLTRIMGSSSDAVIEDFCDAAEEGDILEAADDMLRTLRALEDEPELDLSKLFRIYLRGERTPKRAGLTAANAVRDYFGIDTRDREGGEALLNCLGLQPIVYDREGIHEVDEPVLHGSMRRCVNQFQLNLIRNQHTSRRYDAVRGCYLGWAMASSGDRLVTRARVPDQQASRIFAAEVLAPIDYIRSRARNNLLSQYGVADIARELKVSNAVVAWQAKHHRITLAGPTQGYWS